MERRLIHWGLTNMRILIVLVLLSSQFSVGKDRVQTVRESRLAEVKKLVEAKGLRYPVDEVYLRAFKEEKVVELWAGKKGKPLTLIKSYAICAASGELGPKRKEGDLQVPEGFYEVPEFNPGSNFHLSMKVSYPNASDKIRSDKTRPGGLIYMHGNCASIGCISIEDAPIEEVYLIALDSKVRPIRIDIFPFQMTTESMKKHESDVQFSFWNELVPGFREFELSQRPAKFTVSKLGEYQIVPLRHPF